MGKKVLFVTVLFLLLATTTFQGACGNASPAEAESQKTVKVGLSLSLTGAIASTTYPTSLGVQSYMKYVNDVLGGVKYRTATGATDSVYLDILSEDSAYNVSKALSIYKRQKAAGVMVMYSVSGSMATGLTELVVRDEMPIVQSTGALPVTLGERTIFITSFLPSTADHIKGVMKGLQAGWKEARPLRFGSIAVESPEARAGFTDPSVAEYAKQIGVEYLGNEWVPYAITDSSIELNRLSSKQPDYVFMYHVTGQIVTILKDAQRLDLTKKSTFVVTPYGFDENLLVLGKDVAEGVYGFAYTAATTDNVPGQKLMKDIADREGMALSTMSENGIVAGMVIVEGLRIALEKAGYDSLTSKDINAGIQSIMNLDTGGVVPAITISPNYPVINKYLKPYRISGGKLESQGDWVEIPMGGAGK